MNEQIKCPKPSICNVRLCCISGERWKISMEHTHTVCWRVELWRLFVPVEIREKVLNWLPLFHCCSISSGIFRCRRRRRRRFTKSHARSMSQKSCVQKSCTKVKRKILVAPIQFWLYAAIEHVHIFSPSFSMDCIAENGQMRFRLMWPICFLWAACLIRSIQTIGIVGGKISSRFLWVSDTSQ